MNPASEVQAPRSTSSNIVFPSSASPASRRHFQCRLRPDPTSDLTDVLTSLFLPRISAPSGRLPNVPPFPSASGRAYNNLPPISPYSFLPVCLLLLVLLSCIIWLFQDVSIPLYLYLYYILVYYIRLSSSRDCDATSPLGSHVAHI